MHCEEVVCDGRRGRRDWYNPPSDPRCREMWTAQAECLRLHRCFVPSTSLVTFSNPLFSWPLINHPTWTFLLRTGNIYYLPGQTVPGCGTAIKQEDCDVSFGSQARLRDCVWNTPCRCRASVWEQRRAMADEGSYTFLWP